MANKIPSTRSRTPPCPGKILPVSFTLARRFKNEIKRSPNCEIIEINVVGLGWCQYENEEDRDKQVVYCKNGCWKIKGDKTAKDEEGNYCETDDE